MRDDPGSDVSRILDAIGAGNAEAVDVLYTRVYDELRAIAGRFMAGERRDHTLQPTAVVNEAYLRLCGPDAPAWQSRGHFFGAAAEAMRRILVDHARRKASLKRGGDRQRVELDDAAAIGDADFEELLALDQALDRLEARDAAMAQVVKLRYFAGLSVQQTAEALGLSPRSVNRSWTAARAWLRRAMSPPADDPAD